MKRTPRILVSASLFHIHMFLLCSSPPLPIFVYVATLVSVLSYTAKKTADTEKSRYRPPAVG